ncbi:MAG: hypothetical protein R3B96_08550 [Pirellulaceae bacterium]
MEAEATGSPISTTVYSNPLSSWIGKPGKWTLSVLDSLAPLDEETGTRSPETLIKIASTFVLLTLLLAEPRRCVMARVDCFRLSAVSRWCSCWPWSPTRSPPKARSRATT